MLKLYVWFTTLPFLARVALLWGGSVAGFLAIGFVLFMKGY